jgi:hypothetical protein
MKLNEMRVRKELREHADVAQVERTLQQPAAAGKPPLQQPHLIGIDTVRIDPFGRCACGQPLPDLAHPRWRRSVALRGLAELPVRW